MTPAERQRRWYARQKSGRSCLTVEVDEVRLAAMLVDEGTFLSTGSPSPEQLADAVERLLEAFLTRYEKERWPEL